MDKHNLSQIFEEPNNIVLQKEQIDFLDKKIENTDVISLKNINFYYKSKVQTLKDCNFCVKKGAFHAFIGENGAGKSTTIKLLTGLVRNYYGQILINNLDPKINIQARKGLCFIPDQAIFPNNWNTENFLLQNALLNSQKDKRSLKKVIEQLLTQHDLISIKNKNPNKLSAGQKKKVLIIKAILDNSELIILDEPAANLDPTSRIQFFNILKDLNSQGKTIFISSHILEEIKHYVDSATIISKGQIVFNGMVNGNDLIQAYNDFVINGLSPNSIANNEK